MRRYLIALLAAVMLYSCDQGRQPPLPINPDINLARIEREFRKHDRWVSNYVEQDYKNQRREGFISFRRDRAEPINGYMDVELLAGYNPQLDFLIFPPTLSLSEETIDAIDHELWHSIYDIEGKKGLLHSPDFSGPSLEEIAAFARKKTSGEEYQEIRGQIQHGRGLLTIKNSLQHMEELHGKVLLYCLDTRDDALEYFKSHGDAHSDIDPELHHKIVNQADQLDKDIAIVLDIVKEFRDWYIASIESLANNPDKLPDAFDYIQELQERIKEYDGITDDASQLQADVWKLIDDAEDKQYTTRKEQLEAQLKDSKDETEKQGILSRLETLESVKDVELSVREVMGIFGKADGLFGNIQKTIYELQSQGTTESMEAILNSPDEVMGRVIDSLCSLYHGPVSQNKFPLTREDLEFLRRFMYKGQRLFGKGIEKYELGLQMIEDGISPQSVKEQLEFATSFTYKGKQYNWPEARFSIKGQIPKLELKEN